MSNLCGTDLRRENSNAEKEEWRTVRLRQGLRSVKGSNLERDGRIPVVVPRDRFRLLRSKYQPAAFRSQMLWNWSTIDTCFISRTRHARSAGGFPGSCISVILLVIALEFLRQSQRGFDRYNTCTVQLLLLALLRSMVAVSRVVKLPSTNSETPSLFVWLWCFQLDDHCNPEAMATCHP